MPLTTNWRMKSVSRHFLRHATKCDYLVKEFNFGSFVNSKRFSQESHETMLCNYIKSDESLKREDVCVELMNTLAKCCPNIRKIGHVNAAGCSFSSFNCLARFPSLVYVTFRTLLVDSRVINDLNQIQNLQYVEVIDKLELVHQSLNVPESDVKESDRHSTCLNCILRVSELRLPFEKDSLKFLLDFCQLNMLKRLTIRLLPILSKTNLDQFYTSIANRFANLEYLHVTYCFDTTDVTSNLEQIDRLTTTVESLPKSIEFCIGLKCAMEDIRISSHYCPAASKYVQVVQLIQKSRSGALDFWPIQKLPKLNLLILPDEQFFNAKELFEACPMLDNVSIDDHKMFGSSSTETAVCSVKGMINR